MPVLGRCARALVEVNDLLVILVLCVTTATIISHVTVNFKFLKLK